MLWKCCTQYASKFGKLSSGHRTGKGQFSFQSQRKNTQTTTQLHSSHTLAKQCSKFSKPGCNSMWSMNFQITSKRVLFLPLSDAYVRSFLYLLYTLIKLYYTHTHTKEKAEEPEIKLTKSIGSSKKAREFQKNIYFCFIDYTKAFIVWITKKTVKIS